MVDLLKKKYRTSKKAEVDGFWYIPPLDPDDEERIPEDKRPAFKLARLTSNNRRWAAKMARFQRENRRELEHKLIASSETQEKLCRAFCECILLDWRNITQDGKEIPYTIEAGLSLLVDMPDLYDVLASEARDGTNYQDKEEADAIEKSVAS